MDVLTRERAKPALPFAGVYQLIDFPLSNLAHSGITEVWLSLQYQGASLEEPVANGRPVGPRPQPGRAPAADARAGHRLRRTRTGSPRATPTSCSGSATRSARPSPSVVVVLSADHVYRLRLHRRRRDAPRATAPSAPWSPREVPTRGGRRPRHRRGRRGRTGDRVRLQARRAGDGHRRHRDLRVRPAGARSRSSRSCTASGRTGMPTEGDSGLGDFGEHLVPRLVERGRTVAHALPGYWRDLGQPHHYVAAHQDVLDRRPGPVRRPALADPHAPAAARPGAHPRRCRCRRQHRVSGSPGRRRRTSQRARARGRGRGGRRGPQQRALRRHRRGAGRRRGLGGRRRGLRGRGRSRGGPPDADATGDPDQVTIVGTESRVDVKLEAGARLEPGTT